ncbi:ankyrin repeat-containing protein [Rutstroemia sp. NJR-2017a BBW]|nr:ankyrin repeat-containing protein [Rutstroemia sp. NJR-2017a BBW]
MDNPKQLRDLAEEIGDTWETLKTRQLQFKHQQETALTFRDGLSNFSALMESRASTRLGDNVKLLTYISIFYLPLTFCAALRAIPNITDSSTKNPFMTNAVIVGCVTQLYEPYSSSVIDRMVAKHSSDGTGGRRKATETKWEKRAKRFQSSFGPKRSDGEPSEWWIPVYVLRCPTCYSSSIPGALLTLSCLSSYSVRLVLEWRFFSFYKVIPVDTSVSQVDFRFSKKVVPADTSISWMSA